MMSYYKNVKDNPPKFPKDYPIMMWSNNWDEWEKVCGYDSDLGQYISDSSDVIRKDADFIYWFKLESP